MPRGSVGLTLRGPVARRPGRTLYRLAPNQDKPMRSLISYPSIGTWIAGSIGEPVIHAAPRSVSTRQNMMGARRRREPPAAPKGLLTPGKVKGIFKKIDLGRDHSGLSLVAPSHGRVSGDFFQICRRSEKTGKQLQNRPATWQVEKYILCVANREDPPGAGRDRSRKMQRSFAESLQEKKNGARRQASRQFLKINVYISIMIQMISRSHLVAFKGMRLKIKSRYWGTVNINQLFD